VSCPRCGGSGRLLVGVVQRGMHGNPEDIPIYKNCGCAYEHLATATVSAGPVESDCEIGACGETSTGRCGTCRRAFCAAHQAREGSTPCPDLCSVCQAELQRKARERERQAQERECLQKRAEHKTHLPEDARRGRTGVFCARECETCRSVADAHHRCRVCGLPVSPAHLVAKEGPHVLDVRWADGSADGQNASPRADECDHCSNLRVVTAQVNGAASKHADAYPQTAENYTGPIMLALALTFLPASLLGSVVDGGKFKQLESGPHAIASVCGLVLLWWLACALVVAVPLCRRKSADTRWARRAHRRKGRELARQRDWLARLDPGCG
jgi:hypothetical protein